MSEQIYRIGLWHGINCLSEYDAKWFYIRTLYLSTKVLTTNQLKATILDNRYN